MGRISSAVSLSVSTLAVGLAGLSFLESRPAVPAGHREVVSGLEGLPETVAGLERDLADLSARYRTLALRSARGKGRPETTKAHEGSSTSDHLEETVASLRERLNTLESAEKIHLLAQSGRRQVVQKRLMTALDDLRSPDASPEERLEAMETLRAMRKTSYPELALALEENELEEADLAWPMIEIAQDPGVDAHLRGEALRSLAGMKVEEIRQPLMEIFATEESSEVRTGAFDALAWHMADPSVRQALRAAVGDTRHPEVQSRAARLVPKLDHFDRREAARSGEAARDPAAGTSSEK